MIPLEVSARIHLLWKRHAFLIISQGWGWLSNLLLGWKWKEICLRRILLKTIRMASNSWRQPLSIPAPEERGSLVEGEAKAKRKKACKTLKNYAKFGKKKKYCKKLCPEIRCQFPSWMILTVLVQIRNISKFASTKFCCWKLLARVYGQCSNLQVIWDTRKNYLFPFNCHRICEVMLLLFSGLLGFPSIKAELFENTKSSYKNNSFRGEIQIGLF